MRSLLCERVYEMTKQPQYARRETQQLPFLYRLGRLRQRDEKFGPSDEDIRRDGAGIISCASDSPLHQLTSYDLATKLFIGWSQLMTSYAPSAMGSNMRHKGTFRTNSRISLGSFFDRLVSKFTVTSIIPFCSSFRSSYYSVP
jgi:hypothetical protein